MFVRVWLAEVEGGCVRGRGREGRGGGGRGGGRALRGGGSSRGSGRCGFLVVGWTFLFNLGLAKGIFVWGQVRYECWRLSATMSI